MQCYLDNTEHLRVSPQPFISARPPQKVVSCDTVSRWIASAICVADDGDLITDRVRVNDTRGINSTSWALFQCAALDDIRMVAHWQALTFVSCYLRDVLDGDSSFAKACLSTASHTSQ